jgi:hypothetical protein
VHNYAETAVKLAERDLRLNGRLGPDAEALLQTLNVTRVVCHGTFANGCPNGFAGLVSEGPLGGVLPIPHAGPAVFSRTLVALAPPAGLEKPMFWSEDFEIKPREQRVIDVEDFLHRYLDAAQIEPASRIAAFLPVRNLPEGRSETSTVGAPTGLEAAWHPRVVNYSVALERVRMTIASDGFGYAQLAHPWYPASEVRINGRRVEPLEGAIELIVVPIAPGTNTIEITPRVTPIRAVTSAISVLSLVIAIFLAGLLELRSRTRVV